MGLFFIYITANGFSIHHAGIYVNLLSEKQLERFGTDYEVNTITKEELKQFPQIHTMVNLLLEEKENLKISIASIPSEGIFRQQDKSYQTSVIPNDKPIFGLTAGLPVNLESLVGPNGKVFGLDHFGYSAPAKVLDDKFGFTGEKVCQEVLSLLKA